MSYCTLLLFNHDKGAPPNEEEIREELESKEVEKKAEGLKTLISLLLNGERGRSRPRCSSRLTALLWLRPTKMRQCGPG